MLWSSDMCGVMNIAMNFINSLAPGRYGSSFKGVFFKLSLQIDILNTSCEIGFRWVQQSFIDVNIGSDNDCVLLANKISSETMLTEVICHMVSLSLTKILDISCWIIISWA